MVMASPVVVSSVGTDVGWLDNVEGVEITRVS